MGWNGGLSSGCNVCQKIIDQQKKTRKEIKARHYTGYEEQLRME